MIYNIIATRTGVSIANNCTTIGCKLGAIGFILAILAGLFVAGCLVDYFNKGSDHSD